MASVIDLGRLSRVNIREAWPREDTNFSQWLAQEENIELLSDVLGLPLEVLDTEKDIGPFRADIVGQTVDGEPIVIENQFGKTDHDHLGKVLTYAADLDARCVVWIAEVFTEQHRHAIDWLNERVGDDLSIFAIQLELWRIGDSAPAPRFHIVAQPNDWVRSARKANAEVRKASQYASLYTELWDALISGMSSDQAELLRPYANNRGWYAQRFRLPGRKTWLAALASGRDKSAWVEVVLQGDDAAEQFDLLYLRKEQIERDIGATLNWENNEGVKRAKINIRRDADVTDRDSWADLLPWLREYLVKFYQTFGPLLDEHAG